MITRPVLRYPGGKYQLAPWIIQHFPPHQVYVELYGGVGSVLMRKPRAMGEIYNDIDGDVLNVFRTLRDRDQAAELIRLLQLTPFSFSEYKAAHEFSDDPIPPQLRPSISSNPSVTTNPACAANYRRPSPAQKSAWSMVLTVENPFTSPSPRMSRILPMMKSQVRLMRLSRNITTWAHSGPTSRRPEMTPRGGHREGAGRPPKTETKHRTNIRLSPLMIEQLKVIGDGKITKGLEIVVHFYVYCNREEFPDGRLPPGGVD